jgi:pimeloyl-ACP methyl ester carboxylesterase
VTVREVMSTLRAGLAPAIRWLPMPEATPDPRRRPVVLVHGFMGHPDMLRPMAVRLLSEGFPRAERMQYPSTRLPLESIAERVGEFVAGLGVDGTVDLVGHSLGAIACRAWIKCFGGASKVRRFVALGGPHAGTSFYRIVPPWLRPAFDPRGPWVRRLAEGPEPVPTLVVRARYDHQVFPPMRGAIAGAREVVLHGIGHNGLLWSKAAQDAVVAFLQEDEPDSEPAPSADP